MAKLMYFAQLAEVLGSTSEQATLPASVQHVKTLIAWLGSREDARWKALAGDRVAVMVNKMAATPDTAVSDKDEIAFIPERLK